MTTIFEQFADHIASYGLSVDCAMDGDVSSKIAIIGEYPGEQEVAFNKPFMGAAGKLLWNSLRNQGILRPDVYTTNLVKRRVPSTSPLSAPEFTLWKEALEYELSLLPNLEYIVSLGSSVLSALLGLDGVDKFRGSVLDYKHCKVIVANNPAAIIRAPEKEIIFHMDMARVKEVINGDYKPHYVKSIINPSFDDAMDYLNFAQKNKKFSVDIEVVGMETACLGIGVSPHEAMCIPFRTKHDNYFTLEQEYHILRKFLEISDDTSTEVIAQNGNFDAYFMGYKDHARFRVNFDTLLAHHTLYPRLPHNLGFLTSQYTSHPYYKDEKDVFHEGGDLDTFWVYNTKDAALTYAIAEKEREELKQQNLYDFFTTIVMGAHPHLCEATVVGEAVDISLRQKLQQEINADVGEALRAFHAKASFAAGEEVWPNPNSPRQMTELFFDRFKCKAVQRSVKAENRAMWLNDPRVGESIKETIIAYDKYQQEHKFLSTYVDTTIDPDNRFRTEFRQFGVTNAPGRLSSTQTLWGSGGNAQNQPKRAYEMFIPDEGCVHIYFDLAQAEARYVGWDAGIEKWKEQFELARTTGNYDAHRALASEMFKVPYDEVPKEDEDEEGNFTIRYIAKRCRHGLNYRMMPARLATTTGLSLGQAQRNYYLYHQTNPELKTWWSALEREVKKKRMLFNSFGRRLLFLDRLDGEDALASIVAFRPQSTIGDKVTTVWKQCQEDDRWNPLKARIIRNVHDALWGVATPDFAMTALSIMKAYAEQPIMITSIVNNKTSPLIIPADCKISDTTNGKPLSMANMMKVKLEAAKL